MELKDIRKSAFVTYRHCQKRFQYLYNDPDYWNYGSKDSSKASKAIQLGLAFHEACDHFFDDLREQVLYDSLPRKFKNPFSIDDGILYDWFTWFMETETQRYIDLLTDGDQGYWYPLACELEVKHIKEGAKIGKTGHIDRIDLMPDDTIQIVEYKAGKSYNMDNKYALADMNQEIGFYATILNDTNAFDGKKIKTWKVINPLLGKVWVNRISPISTRAVDRTFNEMVEKITKPRSRFEKNEGVLCNYCPYVDDCLFGGTDLIDFNKKL